jgi:hypothetical protein
MTGAELYVYVLSILKRTDKSTEVYESITDTVMDMRLRFHAEDFKTISSELTIATIGNYSATLPTDFGHIIGDPVLRDTAGDQEYNSPDKISIQRYNELYGDRYNSAVGNRNAGTPIHYCIYGGDLLVGPAVDKSTYVLRIAYTQEAATAIVAGTSSVPFTDRYRKTVRYGVLKEIYLLLENYEEAKIWSDLYEGDLQKIINNDQSNVRDDQQIQYHGV